MPGAYLNTLVFGLGLSDAADGDEDDGSSAYVDDWRAHVYAWGGEGEFETMYGGDGSVFRERVRAELGDEAGRPCDGCGRWTPNWLGERLGRQDHTDRFLCTKCSVVADGLLPGSG